MRLDGYNLPTMKIAKRKKAQRKKGPASKAPPISRLVQELLQSVQQAIAIRRGELRAGRRWRLNKLANGSVLRERPDVPHEPPKEA
jgi:hypothetical protein